MNTKLLEKLFFALLGLLIVSGIFVRDGVKKIDTIDEKIDKIFSKQIENETRIINYLINKEK